MRQERCATASSLQRTKILIHFATIAGVSPAILMIVVLTVMTIHELWEKVSAYHEKLLFSPSDNPEVPLEGAFQGTTLGMNTIGSQGMTNNLPV